MTLSHKVFDACLVAHNMRFWCFLSFYSPVCPGPKKHVLYRNSCTISDLGSNVCGCLDLIYFCHLFSLKSMPGITPVYFSGGHSIWVNVRCYFTYWKEKWKDKIWTAWLVQFDHSPICLWIQLLPLIFLFIFSNVSFSRAQRKDVGRWFLRCTTLLLPWVYTNNILFQN